MQPNASESSVPAQRFLKCVRLLMRDKLKVEVSVASGAPLQHSCGPGGRAHALCSASTVGGLPKPISSGKLEEYSLTPVTRSQTAAARQGSSQGQGPGSSSVRLHAVLASNVYVGRCVFSLQWQLGTCKDHKSPLRQYSSDLSTRLLVQNCALILSSLP